MQSTLLAALAVLGAAPADPVYVDFVVYQPRAYADERRGIFFGTFSFDRSLAKPNGVIENAFGSLPLHSLSFRWLGQRWHPGNARLARVEFDAAGELRSWTIGGAVISGGCGAAGALDCVGADSTVADFTLTATRLEPGIPPPALVAVGVLPRTNSFAEAGGIFMVRERVPAKGR